jgi:hypothetical protein
MAAAAVSELQTGIERVRANDAEKAAEFDDG